MSYNKAILGIDCNGKYVTVSHDGNVPIILPYSLDELINVGKVWFKDSLVEFKHRTHVSSRMLKSLLTSFEDDLVLLEDARVVEFNNKEESCEILVEVTSLGISYGDYLKQGSSDRPSISEELTVVLTGEKWISFIKDLEEVI